jgi:uncharacterized protein YbjT (DUF2867 family)
MIWITGATGRVGGATLNQLSNRGVPVRALLRTPEKAAAVARPVAMIDVDDIAAVAATALTTTGHAGRAYVLTGPEALSYQDVAEKLARILGRPVAYKDIPLAIMRERRLAAGVPEWHADVQVDFSTALSAGHASTVTNPVETVTGKPSRTLEQLIREPVALVAA